MNETTLLKLSMIVATLSLVLLYFYTTSITLDPITSLDTIEPKSTVKLQGTISKIDQQHEKMAFLTVDNEVIQSTKIVLFKNKNISLEKGDIIQIIGSVEEYKGEKEIIGNRVEIIT